MPRAAPKATTSEDGEYGAENCTAYHPAVWSSANNGTRGMMNIGRPAPRREDAKLLTGAGAFLDDLKPGAVTYARFVRSTVARLTGSP